MMLSLKVMTVKRICSSQKMHYMQAEKKRLEI